MPIAIGAIIGLLSFGTTAATPTALYVDTYDLSTFNQSMFGPRSSFSYDSGFQGAAWGTYAGNAPLSTGLNAITGNVRTQITPEVPPETITLSPAFDVRICDPILGLGCYTKHVDAVQVTTPGRAATYADTRTGAAISAESSGRFGVQVTAQASGGNISASLPMKTVLDIAPTNRNSFVMSNTSTMQSGASITTTAPSFKAGVDGYINLDTNFSATGCVIFAGCSSSSKAVNIDPGRFSIVALDTTSNRPLTAFGIDVPGVSLGKEYTLRSGTSPCAGNLAECTVSGAIQQPALAVVKPSVLPNVTGGQIDGRVLFLSTNTPVLRVTADLTGIAQKVLGAPADLLNPKVDLKVASASGTSFDAQAGITMGLSQKFNLNISNLSVRVQFDKPVNIVAQPARIGYSDSCDCLAAIPAVLVPASNVIVFNANNSIEFVGNANVVSRTYFMNNGGAVLTEDNRLSIDPSIPLKGACYAFDLAFVASDTSCAFDQEFKTTNLLDISAYKSNFILGGFSTALFSGDFLALPGEVGPGLPPAFAEVPEPGIFWLFLIAGIALVLVSSRKTVVPKAAFA